MAISALHNANGNLAPRETVAAAIEALRALVTDGRGEHESASETAAFTAIANNSNAIDRRDREAAIKYAIDHNVDPLALIDRADKAERELEVQRALTPQDNAVRVARDCLEIVRSSGVTPVGAPGSVMREAWELGRRLENLSDEVDRLSALVKQMSESRDEVLRKMQKNYDIVVSQANAHNEARIDAIKERGIAVDRANAAESVVAELKVALERAIQQRDTRTATAAISDVEIVSILSRVAAINPDAIQLFTQLLGVPACPKCDRVMRPGHVCK